MKYLFAFLTVLFISCDNEEDTVDASSPLLGTWQLIETLRDPGDGSGTFTPVTSDQTLTFFSSGKVTSNSAFCQMSNETDGNFSANFIFDEAENEGVITTLDCPTFNLLFSFHDNNLIVSYPCIEPCGDKYVKTSSD